MLAEEIDRWIRRYYNDRDVSWADFPRAADYVAAMLTRGADLTVGSAATVLTIVIPHPK